GAEERSRCGAVALGIGSQLDSGVNVDRVVERTEPDLVVGARRGTLDAGEYASGRINLVGATGQGVASAGRENRIGNLGAANQAPCRDGRRNELAINLEPGFELVRTIALQHDRTRANGARCERARHIQRRITVAVGWAYCSKGYRGPAG